MMPAMAGREETWLVWEKRNPELSLLAWEAAAAQETVSCCAVREGVLACTDTAAPVKGCEHPPHPPPPWDHCPLPVSHVHSPKASLASRDCTSALAMAVSSV